MNPLSILKKVDNSPQDIYHDYTNENEPIAKSYKKLMKTESARRRAAINRMNPYGRRVKLKQLQDDVRIAQTVGSALAKSEKEDAKATDKQLEKFAKVMSAANQGDSSAIKKAMKERI